MLGTADAVLGDRAGRERCLPWAGCWTDRRGCRLAGRIHVPAKKRQKLQLGCHHSAWKKMGGGLRDTCPLRDGICGLACLSLLLLLGQWKIFCLLLTIALLVPAGLQQQRVAVLGVVTAPRGRHLCPDIYPC